MGDYLGDFCHLAFLLLASFWALEPLKLSTTQAGHGVNLQVGPLLKISNYPNTGYSGFLVLNCFYGFEYIPYSWVLGSLGIERPSQRFAEVSSGRLGDFTPAVLLGGQSRASYTTHQLTWNVEGL